MSKSGHNTGLPWIIAGAEDIRFVKALAPCGQLTPEEIKSQDHLEQTV